jgi:hypothetical protein
VAQVTKLPAAEVVVDAETVRALLKAQHPDLSDLSLQEAAVVTFTPLSLSRYFGFWIQLGMPLPSSP